MADFVDNGSWVRVRVDRQFAEFLNDSRIFSVVRKGQPSRWIESNHVSFAKTTKMEPYTAVYMGELLYQMGSFSFVTTPFNVNACGLAISFGRYCSIGGGARITGPEHPLTSLSTAATFFDATINIAASYMEDVDFTDFPYVRRLAPKGAPVVGHDVWFGENVWLNTGLRIGDGAVIAANAMVTRSVPDYAIVGGNPARVIRTRFAPEIIAELQMLCPWNYAPKDLGQFDVSNIERFVATFAEARNQLQVFAPPKAHLWEAYRKIHGL